MGSTTILKSYTLSVAALGAQFSVGFTEMNDGAAIQRATRWFADHCAGENESFKVVGPNGREVLQSIDTEAKPPT